MKNAVRLAAYAVLASLAWSVQVNADTVYNADFVAELRALDRHQEAFQYALTWAGSGDAVAELEVALSLLDGRGIEPDPMAAMRFVCGPRNLSEHAKRVVLVQGNLRLAGTGAEIVRCDAVAGTQ
jgi:hypothetical protein